MKQFVRILLIFVILSLPVLTILTSIRIALTPVYVNVEYRLPGFPKDEFGLSTNERLTWSQYSIGYLLGRTTHEELSNQKIKDGTPLFNERELNHMVDVKNLTLIVLRVWQVLLLFFFLMILVCWNLNLKKDLWSSILKGSWLTILLIAGILAYLALNFNLLFTQFHQVFFEGDSWLFLMSDNLIRLFPLRFWRDIFIFIGSLSIFISVLLIILGNRQLVRENKKAQH